VTVLAAGHETTATAVAWAFERLLRTPRVLDRLTQSLAGGDEYLEATIKETLRMRPVVTDVGRLLTREIELGGYRIPAGALVMPAITGIHFREDLYPQPDEFRPERFLDRTPEPYAWIPFGGGVRRCIGAAFAQFEMRVIIRTILERARLRAASPRPERSKLRNVTSAPARGCRVVLESLSPPSGRLPTPVGGEAVVGVE
jgi:cytochrome P450 family 135